MRSDKTTWSYGHMTLWLEFAQGKSPSWHILEHRDSGSGDIMVLVCHMILQNNMINVIWLDKLVPMKVSWHPAGFGGHSHHVIREIMVSFSHVISRDRVTKRASYIGRSPSRWFTILLSFVEFSCCGSGDILV